MKGEGVRLAGTERMRTRSRDSSPRSSLNLAEIIIEPRRDQNETCSRDSSPRRLSVSASLSSISRRKSSPSRLKNVSGREPGAPEHVFATLNSVTWWLQGGYMVVTWWLHGGYMVVTWWLHGDYMVVTWWLHGGYMVVTSRREAP